MTNDPVNYVRQGALIASALIMIQQTEITCPKVTWHALCTGVVGENGLGCQIFRAWQESVGALGRARAGWPSGGSCVDQHFAMRERWMLIETRLVDSSILTPGVSRINALS